MGEEKLGRERPPSPRELATAYGILQGKSTAQAMRDAGYSATTANVKAGRTEARLRALGLLPTPEDARDVVAMMRAVIIEEDGGAALKQAFRTTLARAQAGDIGAMRFIMEYLAGKPTQRIETAGPGGGPVPTVTRVVFDWQGDAEPDPDPSKTVVIDISKRD